MRHTEHPNQIIGIKLAYYNQKDWSKFLDSVDDRKKMHDTWDKWHQAFLKTKIDLITQGFEVIDIIVDIDELSNYCKLRGIKNTGKARSQFVLAK